MARVNREELFGLTQNALAQMDQAIKNFKLKVGDEKSLAIRDLCIELDLPRKHLMTSGKDCTIKEMVLIKQIANRVIWVATN